MFYIHTHVRGNVDFGEDPNRLPPSMGGSQDTVLTAPTLLELQRVVREWQAKYAIGGGHWGTGVSVFRDVVTTGRRSGRVHTSPELVGHMSYNGRIWTGNGIEVLAATE